jgi:hypothetical protein
MKISLHPSIDDAVSGHPHPLTTDRMDVRFRLNWVIDHYFAQ